MNTRNRIRNRGAIARHDLPGMLLLALLGAALLLSPTGCNFDRALAGDDEDVGAGLSAEPAFRGLSVEDLPPELNLTDAQRTELAAALGELRQDRHQRRSAWRESRRSGRGESPRADRGPGRRGGRGRGRAGAGDAEPGDLPPMADFLEAASNTLNTDQFVTLVGFLSEGREQLGPGPHLDPGGRGGADGMRGGPPALRDGFLGIAARRLGLSSDQEQALRPVLDDYREGMRDIREGFAAGTATAEQARDRSLAVRRDAEARTQSILTPEQWRRVQELRDRRREHFSDRWGDRVGRGCDRRVAFTTRVLGLDDTQASSVRKIYEASIPARRQVWDQVGAGSLQPEEAIYAMHQVEQQTDEQVRQVLTPDQLRRYDALRTLLPPGPRGPRH